MSEISLEIHHLDVHGGDSTAIVVKDMTQEVWAGGKTIYRMLMTRAPKVAAAPTSLAHCDSFRKALKQVHCSVWRLNHG